MQNSAIIKALKEAGKSICSDMRRYLAKLVEKQNPEKCEECLVHTPDYKADVHRFIPNSEFQGVGFLHFISFAQQCEI